MPQTAFHFAVNRTPKDALSHGKKPPLAPAFVNYLTLPDIQTKKILTEADTSDTPPSGLAPR